MEFQNKKYGYLKNRGINFIGNKYIFISMEKLYHENYFS